MEFEELLYTVRQKFLKSVSAFVPLAIGLLIFITGIRIFEYFFIWKNSTVVNTNIGMLAFSLLYDLVFYLNLSVVLFILFFLTSFINIKLSRVLFYSFAAFFICGYLMLVFYFSKTSIPLGSDIFGYSYEEISHTVKASGGVGLLPIVGFIGLIAVIILLLFLSTKIKYPLRFEYLFYSLAAISVFTGAFINPAPKDFISSSEYFLAVNKLQFFLSKNYTYLFDKDIEIPLSNYYFDSSSDGVFEFTYLDNKYHFLHGEKTNDVLGNFFNIDTLTKPNFVFIITESLGKGYSGRGAYLGSFTPFLDSLSEHSLYWDNFLSTGGRTFAALPSMFGSLPFLQKGFMEAGNLMPVHFSLIKYLKSFGYSANFYHGGDAHFDLMDVFLKRQNIDFILSELNFGSGYKKMPPKANGFSWGYGDRELFTKSFETITRSNSPQINIYLTLSMHDPFQVANQDFYRKKFDEIVSGNNFNSELRKTLLNYKDMLSCVLYTDDAFRMFFNKYKKRSDFNNTIFIITGDHRMPEIPIITQIDRFHVPLVIYSPMLKRFAKFSSISSHFDITPTLLAFLKNNYKMSIPAVSTFMGGGLDTNRQFRNIHNYPLMRNKNELLDYLYKEYFLSDQTLYRIDDNLNIIPSNDEVVSIKVKNEFESFKARNNSLIRNNMLAPDSISKWGNK